MCEHKTLMHARRYWHVRILRGGAEAVHYYSLNTSSTMYLNRVLSEWWWWLGWQRGIQLCHEPERRWVLRLHHPRGPRRCLQTPRRHQPQLQHTEFMLFTLTLTLMLLLHRLVLQLTMLQLQLTYCTLVLLCPQTLKGLIIFCGSFGKYVLKGTLWRWLQLRSACLRRRLGGDVLEFDLAATSGKPPFQKFQNFWKGPKKVLKRA